MDREFLEDFLEKLRKTTEKHWKNKVLQKVGKILNIGTKMPHDVSSDVFAQIFKKKSYSAFVVLAKS